MLELLVVLLRVAAFGGSSGIAGHGLVLVVVLTLIRYLVRARKRAGSR